MTDSRIKVDMFRTKSATKFLCVKNFSGKGVRHSLAYLSVHKWLVGDVQLLRKILGQSDAPHSETVIFKLFSLVPSPSKKTSEKVHSH